MRKQNRLADAAFLCLSNAIHGRESWLVWRETPWERFVGKESQQCNGMEGEKCALWVSTVAPCLAAVPGMPPQA